MSGRWRVELPLFFFAMVVIALLARYAVSEPPVEPGYEPVKGDHPSTVRAVAVLQPVGGSGVGGVVYLTSEGNHVQVTGKVTGLTQGKHGFHIHEYGDLTDLKEGKSAGDHYNPEHLKHGRPADSQRHAGDFGNIEAGANGEASFSFSDSVVHLTGPHSVLGRSLVVHAAPDKFSQPSGDAGARVAVGVIGIANPKT